MKRILVDRSIFHGDKFMQIQASGFLNAVHSEEIQVYYTAEFLDETLRNIRRDMSTFSEHWNYLYDLNHRYWFKTPYEIIRAECTYSASGDYFLMAEDDINNTLNIIKELIRGEKSLTILETAVEEIRIERERMDGLRQKILADRQEKQFSIGDFEPFVLTNAENHFRDILLPCLGISTNIISRWKKTPEEFPFTNYYIRCLLLALFLPIADHRLAVHINDKSDAEQLSFLLWTDILATDDIRFMTKAFNILNREGKKECWTQIDLMNQFTNRKSS